MSEKDVRLSQLSRKTGIARNTLYGWLGGNKPRDLDQLKIIADYFAVSLDELCFEQSALSKNSHSLNEKVNLGIYEVILLKPKING